MSSLLKILYLEDEQSDIELVSMTLRSEGIDCEIVHEETCEDFMNFRA